MPFHIVAQFMGEHGKYLAGSEFFHERVAQYHPPAFPDTGESGVRFFCIAAHVERKNASDGNAVRFGERPYRVEHGPFVKRFEFIEERKYDRRREACQDNGEQEHRRGKIEPPEPDRGPQKSEEDEGQGNPDREIDEKCLDTLECPAADSLV